MMAGGDLWASNECGEDKKEAEDKREAKLTISLWAC